MKPIIVSVVIGLGLALSAQAADVNVKISNVHLCCQSCVTGVEKAVGAVQGVTATADRSAGTVSMTGPDTATVQKAADALVAAGYFGASSDPAVKINDSTGAKGQKMQSLTVSGVHLCCNKCVAAVDETLKGVSGVKGHTAKRDAKSFDVTGDFNDKDVFAALQKAGLAGKAGN